jgi:predicted nucleic acid-binding Zn ribbon protein
MPAIAPEPEPAVEVAAGSVPEGVLVCPDCGAENVPGELFCDVCGNPLEAPEPVAEPVIEAEPVVEPVVEQVLEAEPIIQPEPVVGPATGAASYCPTCGAGIQPDDTFCGNCGASLDTTAFEDEIAPVEPILDGTVEQELQAQPTEIEPVTPDQVLVDQVLIEEVIVEEEPFEQVVVEETLVDVVPVAVPVAEALGAEPVAEAVVAPEEPQCPVCGANVLPDQTFCASCGAALEPTAAAPEPEAIPEPAVAPVAESTIGPFVEIADSGAYIPLVDQPELLVGRVDEISGVYPDVDLTPHGGEEAGVSRRHARLIREGNAWFVVDLNSTNGTFVNGTELQANTRAPLSDGDRLTLGELEIIVHIQ